MSQLSPSTEPDAEIETAADEAPPSAGEEGEAGETSVRSDGAEIIIGEIPDTEDLAVMRWTARCTVAAHDLLGHYDSRDEAEQAGAELLALLHSSR